MKMKTPDKDYSPSLEGKRPKQLEFNFEQYADPDPHQAQRDVEAGRAASHQQDED